MSAELHQTTGSSKRTPTPLFPHIVLASPLPHRAPGHYWVMRNQQVEPPQPGQWMDGLYWLINGQAARDDEVTVLGERLDPPQVNAISRATPGWIEEPVATALTALNAALAEAQDAVRLRIATGEVGSTILADLVARRNLAAQAVEALSAILTSN